MSKDNIIHGIGSSRSSSIKAYLRKHGNIASTIKHCKNDIYKIILDFDESEEAAEALKKAGAIILKRSRRRLVITFTKAIEYVAQFTNGGIKVPPQIMDSFNFKEGMLIQWRVEYVDSRARIALEVIKNV